MQCFVAGECEGDFIDALTSSSASDCLGACQSDQDCLWFNYESSDGTCILLGDCFVIEDDCDTCVTGHRACDEGETSPTTTTSSTTSTTAGATTFQIQGANKYLTAEYNCTVSKRLIILVILLKLKKIFFK